MLNAEKVATPATAATAPPPDRCAPPLPVPLVIARVTLGVDVVTVFPDASSTATWTDGLMVAPAVVAAG